MDSTDVIKCLSALAQETRLQIFRALVVAGPQGLTPSLLAEQLGLAGATLSFHLKELSHAGLITQRRESRNLHYSASFGQMNQLLSFLTENCCAGQPCATEVTNPCDC